MAENLEWEQKLAYQQEKLHARGPVGADQLTTFKYVVKGQGQLRS